MFLSCRPELWCLTNAFGWWSQVADVDRSTVGSYSMDISAADAAGNTATDTITVQVEEQVAVTLVGSASMTLEAGVDSFVDPGATAHSTPLSAAVPPAPPRASANTSLGCVGA